MRSDPIEAGAIADAFEHCISPAFPLYVGSVKSNIGHLEGTSGIAGLIKCVLMLEQGMIPGIAGLEAVNATIAKRHPSLLVFLFLSKLYFTNSGLTLNKFPQRLCRWPSEGLRRLSINSFGFGGSNAHVIMEDAQNHLKLAGRLEYQNNHLFASENSYPQMLIFSAQDEKGIGRLALTYSQHFAASEHSINDDYMSHLVYTLNERRSLLLWRSFAICNTPAQLAEGIKTSRPVRALTNPRLALCFTGQGAQWATMGDNLRQFKIYNQSISDASVILKNMGCPWNLEGRCLIGSLLALANRSSRGAIAG
jgi:acyl transferase domain-containing protein